MAGGVEGMNSTPARRMTPKKTLLIVSRSCSPTSPAKAPREAREEKSSRARGTATRVRSSGGTSGVARAAGAAGGGRGEGRGGGRRVRGARGSRWSGEGEAPVGVAEERDGEASPEQPVPEEVPLQAQEPG